MQGTHAQSLAAELRFYILCCGPKEIYALNYYIISLLLKIRIEGNFLNPIENLSETNNKVAVMRLPEVYAEIDEGFLHDIL